MGSLVVSVANNSSPIFTNCKNLVEGKALCDTLRMKYRSESESGEVQRVQCEVYR